MLNREAFGKAIIGLSESLGSHLSSAAVAVYYAVLRDLPDEAWRAALGKAATTATRHQMPTPAELRQLAGEQAPDERAAVAWREARDAVARWGTYDSVAFEDRAINATIRALFGGWIAFCRCPEEELEQFKRREFVRLYPAFARNTTPEQGKHLVGLAEMAGHAREPRRIGATTRAVGAGLAPGAPGSPLLASGGRAAPSGPVSAASVLGPVLDVGEGTR